MVKKTNSQKLREKVLPLKISETNAKSDEKLISFDKLKSKARAVGKTFDEAYFRQRFDLQI